MVFSHHHGASHRELQGSLCALLLAIVLLCIVALLQFLGQLYMFFVVVVVVFSLFPSSSLFDSVLLIFGKWRQILLLFCLYGIWSSMPRFKVKLFSFFKKNLKFCKCNQGKVGLLLPPWAESRGGTLVTHSYINESTYSWNTQSVCQKKSWFA